MSIFRPSRGFLKVLLFYKFFCTKKCYFVLQRIDNIVTQPCMHQDWQNHSLTDVFLLQWKTMLEVSILSFMFLGWFLAGPYQKLTTKLSRNLLMRMPSSSPWTMMQRKEFVVWCWKQADRGGVGSFCWDFYFVNTKNISQVQVHCEWCLSEEYNYLIVSCWSC